MAATSTKPSSLRTFFQSIENKSGAAPGAAALPQAPVLHTNAPGGGEALPAGQTSDNGVPSSQTAVQRLGSDVVMAAPLVNARLIPMPDPKGVKLPTDSQGGDPYVDITVEGSGKKESMKVSAVRASPYYVDNAARQMKAWPSNQSTLEVNAMTFTASDGGTFEVEMDRIVYGPKLPALRFVRKGKYIYPVDITGQVLFDTVNTPQIVKFAQWLNDEIPRRRALREKIFEAGFMFQIALAQLGAAVGPPEVPGGSVSMLRIGGRGKAPTPVSNPNPAALEAEAVANFRRDPSSINYTMSSSAHEAVWVNLGNKPPAPIAFRVGDKIRVDVQRWPKGNLGDIGLKLRETPIVAARRGGDTPPAPEIEFAKTQPPPPNSPTAAPPAATNTPATTSASANSSAGRTGANTAASQPPAPRPNTPRPPGPKGDIVSPQLAHKMAAEGKQVFASASSETHQMAWEALGREGTAPVAFIRDRQVYVDLARWPKDLPPPATIAPPGGPKINHPPK